MRTAIDQTAAPADACEAALLTVTDLSVRFGPVQAVNHVSFSLGRGETLGLVGESGSGKSTLGRALLQITNGVCSGSINFGGAELTELRGKELRLLRRQVQMVFQDPRSSLDPRMRVREVLGEPFDIHGTATGTAREAKIDELLRLVGLSPTVADRFPHEFSGGQAQRIAIARALALEPRLIVADEPVSALDVSVQAQIINLLVKLRQRLDLSMIFIAHDLAVVRYVSDRVAVMYLGRVVEIADKIQLYARPSHPYTKALLSAVPIPDPTLESRRARTVLVGDLPSPADLPSGCAFRTRCPLRAKLGDPEICRAEIPPLRSVGTRQAAACHFAES